MEREKGQIEAGSPLEIFYNFPSCKSDKWVTWNLQYGS